MENLKKWLKKIMFNEIVIAIIIALLLKNFVVDSRYIPSSSMYPTLQIQDRLLINKLSPRFGEFERGDIIIFRPPPSVAVRSDHVKRLIALPGDIVEVSSGVLYINGEAVQEDFIYEVMLYELPPIEVPENSLFVLGDNRNWSQDSHRWADWVTKDDVRGTVFFRYWPFDRFGRVE